MPIHKINVTDSFVEVFVSSDRSIRLDYASFDLTQQSERGRLKGLIQAFLDTRQRLNTLPGDDPDRSTDPARPDLFWDGPGQPGNTDLVSRPIEVGEITWDGSRVNVPLKRL